MGRNKPWRAGAAPSARERGAVFRRQGRLANFPVPAKGQVTHWDALKGFGCRVSYGGSKTFIVMHGPRGRGRRTIIGTFPRVSLSEARWRARQILAQITLGQHKPKSTTTFDVALEKYLAQKATDS